MPVDVVAGCSHRLMPSSHSDRWRAVARIEAEQLFRAREQPCLQRARAAGVGWPLPEDLTDAVLESRLYPASIALAEIKVRPQPDWPALHRAEAEEKRKAEGRKRFL